MIFREFYCDKLKSMKSGELAARQIEPIGAAAGKFRRNFAVEIKRDEVGFIILH